MLGLEGRLIQVIRDLFVNTVSGSSPQCAIILSAGRYDSWIEVIVEDESPGIPSGGNEATIFKRFYSERPDGEKIGTYLVWVCPSRDSSSGHMVVLIFASNHNDVRNNSTRI